MKALSIQPFYATAISLGWKWIELRTWTREYRGWILICATKAINKFERESLVSGHAVCIARLSDIRPYNDENDRELAFLADDETFEGYSWEFDKIIPIVPVPVKGQQNLFNAPFELDDLEPIELVSNPEENEAIVQELFQYWYDHGYIKNLDFLDLE